MKKAYETPQARIVEFDYSDVIVTSSVCSPGHSYEEYVEGYTGCHEKPTGHMIVSMV